MAVTQTQIVTAYLEFLREDVVSRLNYFLLKLLYMQEALQAKEKSQLVLQEVKRTTEVVNGLLTASRLQAESSFMALGMFQTQPSHISIC